MNDAVTPISANPAPEARGTLETITSIRRWTDSLLTFRTTRPADYPFVPGQYSRLGLAAGDDVLWRAYSLTSAPVDKELEYYSIVVPNGAFTTLLDQAKVGDGIWIDRQRFGFMTADRFSDGEDLWMLATGTGIGPYISILRDPAVWQQFKRLVLVHCTRHADELTYQDELAALQQAAHGSAAAGTTATLQRIQLVTRDNPQAAGILHGRITTLLQSGELENAAGMAMTAESSRVMLCGNPAMIEETRGLLHQRGMRPCRRAMPGHFVTENYW